MPTRDSSEHQPDHSAWPEEYPTNTRHGVCLITLRMLQLTTKQ
jgi:hypothetical protein